MRSPNNVLFYSTHCIFDESMFPKCAKPAKAITHKAARCATTPSYTRGYIPVDEEVTPHAKPLHKKEREREQEEDASTTN
jgi:hypothetical protein